METAIDLGYGIAQQRLHVVADDDDCVDLGERLAQLDAGVEVGPVKCLVGVAEHAMAVADGGQAVVSEALWTGPDVASPAQFAETGQVVIVHVPQQDAPRPVIAATDDTTAGSNTLCR